MIHTESRTLASGLFDESCPTDRIHRLCGPDFKFRYEADGFPAAEMFQIRGGVAKNIFNTSEFFGKAPSPLAMAAFEVKSLWPLTFWTGCDPLKEVKAVMGPKRCVPLSIQADGVFSKQ
jgi:hypothetical protein